MILNEITPVQFYDGLYWKRDDYFKPFGEYHVNGGKVRQAIRIFEHKLDEIKIKIIVIIHNNVIGFGSMNNRIFSIGIM